MGLCRLPRTVRKSVGERWRDGARCLLTLGIGSHRCFARMLARAVDATDFGPSGKRDGAVPAGAHSLQEHRRAMARRRRQLAYLKVPVAPTLARMLVWVVGATEFRASKTAVRRSLRRRTVCARVRERWRDGAGRLPTLNYGSHRYMLTSRHGRWICQILPPRTGVGIVPVAGHSLREGRRAMTRRRIQFAYDGFESHRCMHACWHGKLTCRILDCRETVMGLCPRWRTVCQSVGERWCDGESGLAILGIRSLRCLHTSWCGWSTRPIFDCRETVMGPGPRARTVCERVGKRLGDGAG